MWLESSERRERDHRSTYQRARPISSSCADDLSPVENSRI
jgi:hypothetical protein